MIFPQADLCVVGTDEWDGRGSSHTYSNAFKIHITQGKIWYCYADTPTDKEKWMRSLQMMVLVLGAPSTPCNHNIEQITAAKEESPVELSSTASDTASTISTESKKDPTVCSVTGLVANTKCNNCQMKFNEKYVR